jgi:exopolysaccharide biosynthesis glucuronosyltransferase PssE
MIFVTVGTQMHFDRLIEAVDCWAGTFRTEDVFAQTGPSSYVTKHIRTKPFITPQEFRELAQQARVIIGHAGMGSILTTLEFGKRIVVMPRRSDLGEHRNDHQIATAKIFAGQGRILVALDRQQLFERLAQLNGSDAMEPISPMASPTLIATIRQFIDCGNISPALQRSVPHAATIDG